MRSAQSDRGAAASRLATVVAVIAAGAVLTDSAAALEPLVEYDWGVVRCRSEFLIGDPERLGSDLEQLTDSLAQTLELTSDRAILIQLYSSRRRYIAEVSAITPDAARQRGVFVERDLGNGVYSFQQRDLPEILRHETTHAVLHDALPYVPLWLDEGLASYFEADVEDRRNSHPFHRRIQWSLRLGWRPDLEQLEVVRRHTDLDVGDYRHAWAWVHFLLNESDESRAVLVEYLKQIARGEPPQPLSVCLRQKLPDAASRLVRHFEPQPD